MSKTTYISSAQLMSAPLLASHQIGKQFGSTFIVAPHPDDEALGCGGLISFLLSQNEEVIVGFMTSGGASHSNSKSYTPKILTAQREKEAREACKILGMPDDKILFFRHEDAGLENLENAEFVSATNQLVQIMENHNTDTIFLPWRRDPHPDHIATYKIGANAVALANRDIKIVEYPIWLYKNSKQKDWPMTDEIEIFRLNIQPFLDKKKQAIYAHTSQTSQLIIDDPEGFILTEELLEPFLIDFEVFLIANENPAHSLGREYFHTLYSNNPDPWNYTKSTYEKNKYESINSFLRKEKYKKGLELGCSIGVQTPYLAEHCNTLIAIDINEIAIIQAKKRNAGISTIEFFAKDILKDFPQGPFAFISMCEIGYYFIPDELLQVFNKIATTIEKKGHFLMVHWTSYVREYPLTGRQVHQLFEEFNEKQVLFQCIATYTNDNYELKLWEKLD